MGLARAWSIYIVPAAVFQSLMIGGGYGTGREIVEYFTRYGLLGGLLGLLVVTTCFAILLVVSFEFARTYKAYEYRGFFRELLGPGWVAFEALYLAMFAIVLAVICAAAGALFEERLHLRASAGVVILLVIVIVFAFYGRVWVTRILAYKAVALSAVVITYFVLVGWRFHDRILAEYGHHEIVAGWHIGALRYALYASVVIPAMLFAIRGLETRRQAIVCGVTSAVLGMLPGVLMHISFGAGYPQVLTAQLPAYWMILKLDVKPMTIAYIVVLFGSLLDVGLGFIQSVNERLDGWSMERRGKTITRPTRAAVALFCLAISGGLSLVGVVPLIAKGYGTMAWGFLLLFAGPLLSIGVYRLARGSRSISIQPA
jgi:uncharacterized membrane protein YkvI